MRRRCLGAWLTWMCLTIKEPVSKPLESALASAFLRRPRMNSADLAGQRALETPNCLPNIESAPRSSGFPYSFEFECVRAEANSCRAYLGRCGQ